MVIWGIEGLCERTRHLNRPLAMNILAAFVLISLTLYPEMPCSAPVVKAEPDSLKCQTDPDHPAKP